MTNLDQLVQRYEDMENNKELYLQYRNHYETLIDKCILNHDLSSLGKIIDEFMVLNQKHNKALITSDLNRIQHINDALLKEADHDFTLFWEDCFSICELINKYNKTIFMVRRLLFDLPELYKSESREYLSGISPFIIKECYKDVTSLVGMEDFIHITLAMEHLKASHYRIALAFLNNVVNHSKEVNALILQIESLITKSGENNG